MIKTKMRTFRLGINKPIKETVSISINLFLMLLLSYKNTDFFIISLQLFNQFRIYFITSMICVSKNSVIGFSLNLSRENSLAKIGNLITLFRLSDTTLYQ